MAAGEYLPPVITRLTADIDDFVAKIEEAKALIKSLGDVKVNVSADVNTASFLRARQTINALATGYRAPIRLTFDINRSSLAAALAQARAYVRANPVVVPMIFRPYLSTAVASAAAAARTVNVATRAVDTNRVAVGRNNLAWTRWGALTATAIHWIISGLAELAAVLIPATFAAAAWAAVWLQGATNVYQHMQAVYTATEATANMAHTTAGQMVGLGHALQTAQDAANPDVYQALGGAINIVRQHASNLANTGLQVGKVFDTFTAKLVYDLSAAGGAGGRLNHLLANMVPDLTHIGQLFGNIGHALFNFASDMPGLAEVLLGVLDALSRLALFLSSLPGHIFTVIMAVEEFMRWGGLLVTMLGKMGVAVDDLGPKFLSTQRFTAVFMSLFRALPRAIATGISAIGTYLASFGTKWSATLGMAGAKMRNFGADLTDAIQGLTFFQAAAIAAGAALLGYLIYRLVTAKSAAQQLTDSLQKATLAASNSDVYQTIALNVTKLRDALSQTSQEYQTVAKTSAANAVASGKLGAVTNYLRSEVNTLHAGLAQQAQDATRVGHNIQFLAGMLHTSFISAVTLATTAGVKLSGTLTGQSQAAQIARQKILDLVAGYYAMGAPSSAVGQDMQAVAIQAGLTATKVDQLNQAWDQFIGNLTGGTSGFSDFMTALQGMRKDSAATSASIAGSISSIKRNASGMAYTLNGLGANSMQSWQQFNQALGSSAENLASWFRTAAAEGAISAPKFSLAIKSMVASLLPFTQGNKTAMAELRALANEAGLHLPSNLKQAEKEFGSAGKASKVLQGLIDGTTQAMSDMNKVAQNLGQVLGNQVQSALAGDIIKQSGLNTAIQNYSRDLTQLGPNNAKTIRDLATLRSKYNDAMNAANLASRATARMGQSAQQAAIQMYRATGDAHALAVALNGLHDKTINVVTNFISTGYSGPGSIGHHTGGGYASGTLSASPGLHLVGERGPELVSFRGGERVYNASQTRGLTGGGGTVVVQVDGRELFRFMQDSTFNYNVNNNTRSNTGSVHGRLAPR